MIEIYNEQVRDLLNAKSMTIKGGLKIRQHPSKGFVGKSSLYEPSGEKTNNVVSEQVRHKSGYTVTEAG